ncbi:MAG: hypothetical protein ACREFN_04665 [Acetobacteraceae bacterium]
MPARAESTRDLACWLDTICKRKRRTAEALGYNSQTWPEITRLARMPAKPERLV